MARSPFRRAAFVTIAVLASTSLTASAAIAAGTVSVAIDGPGQVTGEHIDCVRPVGAPAPQGVCSASIPDVIECDPDRKPPCFVIPATETLMASALPGSGFSFAGWTGACQGLQPVCDLLVTRNLAAGATFRDTQAPSLTLTPTIAGTIPLTANAGDNVGVARVEFRVRGVLQAVDTTAPYEASFDTTTVADGPATLTAKAIDASGNSKSTTVRVTIDNP